MAGLVALSARRDRRGARGRPIGATAVACRPMALRAARHRLYRLGHRVGRGWRGPSTQPSARVNERRRHQARLQAGGFFQCRSGPACIDHDGACRCSDLRPPASTALASSATSRVCRRQTALRATSHPTRATDACGRRSHVRSNCPALGTAFAEPATDPNNRRTSRACGGPRPARPARSGGDEHPAPLALRRARTRSSCRAAGQDAGA
jgi:hypothetical protein